MRLEYVIKGWMDYTVAPGDYVDAVVDEILSKALENVDGLRITDIEVTL